MVRYAQNSPLPCNPTLEEGKILDCQYKSTNKLAMVSEARLQNRIKSFFNNHLSQIIQVNSVISKGSKSKAFSVQNKRNKTLFSQKKTNLDTLSAYFHDNENMLEALENDLKTNFKNEMMEIFQNIKMSILTTINMYESLVQKEIASIKANIQSNVQSVQEEMKKLRLEEGEKLILTENGKLSHNEISKILSISPQEVKGYETIIKIVNGNVPLMRKLSSLEEGFNDELSSCEREIEGLKIYCDRITCGEMWYVIELLKKKGEYVSVTPSHQNNSFSSHNSSFSSNNNSFTSYQSPTQNSFTVSERDYLSREPNPEVEFNHMKLIGNYQNSLKQAQKEIVCKFYSLLNCYNMSQNRGEGQQLLSENKRQPLSYFFNENLLYKIHLQSKQIVECEFQRLNEKNRSSNIQFTFTNQKGYYEILDSSSEKQEDQDDQGGEQDQSQNKIDERLPRFKPVEKETPFISRNPVPKVSVEEQSMPKNQTLVSFAKQRKETTDSATNDERERSWEKNESDSNDPSIQRQNQSVFQEWFQKSRSKDQDMSSFSSQKESSRNKNLITRRFEQDTIIKFEKQDEESVNEQDESIIHYASDSDDDSKNQKISSIYIKETTQNKNTSFKSQKKLESEVDNEQSQRAQYNEYIKMRKMKYAMQQQKEQNSNQSLNKQDLQQKKIRKQEEKVYEAYQRKLNYEEGHKGEKYRQDLENNDDGNMLRDSHITNIDDAEIDKILYQRRRQENQRFPHNLSHDEKFETQSVIKRDPEKKKIIQDWEKSRQMEKYNYLQKEKQDQELIQYVSYDYEPENQKQKPFPGIMPVHDQFLYQPQDYEQKVLPEDIAQYLGYEVEEKRKIMQQSEKKTIPPTQPKEDSRFTKKIMAGIIPGFHAIKKQKDKKKNQNQNLAANKAEQERATQEYLLQQAINLSLQEVNQRPNPINEEVRKDTNQNFNNLRFDEFSMIEKKDRPGMKRQQNPMRPYGMQRVLQEVQQEDFTVFQDFFKELSSLKATFSLRQNFNSQLFGDEYQDRAMIRNRRDEMTIQKIRLRQDELDVEKEEFSIFVKVLKPILLTFKSLDKYRNRPMSKFIVGDKTGTFIIKSGIAVIYMNYYLEVKAGMCLRLEKCRVCKFRGSYEITNFSRLSMNNILPRENIPTVNELNPLSLIRRSPSNQLTYEVRPSYNELLKDCVRDFFKNKNYEKLITKPLILTVLGATQRDRRYMLGDYTGKIRAELINCPRVELSPNDTVLIRNIRICLRGDTLLLVGQRNTVILKADLGWRFSHDINFIPEELFSVR